MATPAEPPPARSPAANLIKVLLPLAVILVAVVGGLYLVKSRLQPRTAVTATEGGASGVDIGSVLPDFSLTPIQVKGEESNARPISQPISKIAGKVTLINFWATWCEACMVEMPSLVKLYDEMKDRGLQVVGIDLDEKPEAVVPKAARELGIRFPLFLDTDNKVSDLFDVHAIPLTVIIDRNRKVLFMENGERNWNSEEIRSKIEQWLSG